LTDALQKAGRNPQEIVYLQALKVEENEAEIDALVAGLKKITRTLGPAKANA
jgi:ribonuclease HI